MMRRGEWRRSAAGVAAAFLAACGEAPPPTAAAPVEDAMSAEERAALVAEYGLLQGIVDGEVSSKIARFTAQEAWADFCGWEGVAWKPAMDGFLAAIADPALRMQARAAYVDQLARDSAGLAQAAANERDEYCSEDNREFTMSFLGQW
jgi:hypothetical protein